MRQATIATTSGTLVADKVTIASTFRSRFVGLLPRKHLDEREGLLLQPGGSVHTVGMRFPIDVLFLDRRLRILKLATHLAPLRMAKAPRRTHWVLELAAGRAQARKLEVGTHLLLISPEDA